MFPEHADASAALKLTLCSTLFCWALSRWTLMSLLLSSFTLILLPTISLGNTRSSKMASWTAVRVRLREEWGERKKKKSLMLHFQLSLVSVCVHSEFARFSSVWFSLVESFRFYLSFYYFSTLVGYLSWAETLNHADILLVLITLSNTNTRHFFLLKSGFYFISVK